MALAAAAAAPGGSRNLCPVGPPGSLGLRGRAWARARRMRRRQTRAAEAPTAGRAELGRGHRRHALRDPVGQQPGRRHLRQRDHRASRARRYTHDGLRELRRYRYKIVAETSGGRGPESRAVVATPGPGAGQHRMDCRDRREPGPHDLFPDGPGRHPLPHLFRGPRVAARRPAGRTRRSSRPTPRPTCAKTSRSRPPSITACWR